MGNIRKLPFLSGCSAAILAGIVSYAEGVENQTIYIRMAVIMFLFYMIGVLVRNTVENAKKEIEEKKKEMEQEEARKRKKQKEEKMKEVLESRKNDVKHDDGTEPGTTEEKREHDPNLDEEFRVLSDVIMTKAKE
ncbi:MAG TPA: hypothetical protein PK767_02365 [Clostridiales bacterium]|nr:hypothetical protein [Clostridiales bacterium]HOL91807.1 hypothetical protein [Clostridiales bacterium]HPP35071.1 hypothetical protein [Clostridiales bacterium]